MFSPNNIRATNTKEDKPKMEVYNGKLYLYKWSKNKIKRRTN